MGSNCSCLRESNGNEDTLTLVSDFMPSKPEKSPWNTSDVFNRVNVLDSKKLITFQSACLGYIARKF